MMYGHYQHELEILESPRGVRKRDHTGFEHCHYLFVVATQKSNRYDMNVIGPHNNLRVFVSYPLIVGYESMILVRRVC